MVVIHVGQGPLDYIPTVCYVVRCRWYIYLILGTVSLGNPMLDEIPRGDTLDTTSFRKLLSNVLHGLVSSPCIDNSQERRDCIQHLLPICKRHMVLLLSARYYAKTIEFAFGMV